MRFLTAIKNLYDMMTRRNYNEAIVERYSVYYKSLTKKYDNICAWYKKSTVPIFADYCKKPIKMSSCQSLRKFSFDAYLKRFIRKMISSNTIEVNDFIQLNEGSAVYQELEINEARLINIEDLNYECRTSVYYDSGLCHLIEEQKCQEIINKIKMFVKGFVLVAEYDSPSGTVHKEKRKQYGQNRCRLS